MNKSSCLKVKIAVIFFLAAAAASFCQTTVLEGRLEPGDTRLGKYFDVYPMYFKTGRQIIATLTSSDFDAYLFVESPGGVEKENDDYGEDETGSRLEFVTTESGEWKFKVTSGDDGGKGNYKLTITKEYLGEVSVYSGVLDKKDSITLKGEYYDSYTFQARANQRIVVTMESEDFDSYLVVQPPSGLPRINDDYQEEARSLIDFITETGGEYRVYATSSFPAEKGKYDLVIVRGVIVSAKTMTGKLDETDVELDEVGYYDEYTLSLEAGQHVLMELWSDDFDTYLFLEKPDGSEEENDDYNDLTNLSRLEIITDKAGDYIIIVTTYESGETGSYTLKVYTWSSENFHPVPSST